MRFFVTSWLFSEGIVEVQGEYYKKSVRYFMAGKPHYLRFNECHLTLESAQAQAETRRQARIEHYEEKVIELRAKRFTRARTID